MTDERNIKIEIIAHHVMRWVRHPANTIHWVNAEDVGKIDYKVQAIAPEWQPYTNIQDAMQIVKKLEEHYQIVIKTPFEKGETYSAGVTPLGTSGWNGRSDTEGHGESLEEAICSLAIEIAGEFWRNLEG
jgi:hypothetical protein